MSNTVFLKSMPFGAPGTLSRPHVHTNEAHVVDPTNPPTAYGQPVKLVSGKLQPIASGDAASAVYGFLVRQYPTMDFTYATSFGNGVPQPTGTQSVMRRDYMLVQVNAGTAVAQGAVYVRVAAAATGKPIGGIEAAADSTNTVVVAGATFQTAADESGVAEIAYNI